MAEKQVKKRAELLATERAIDELRRQQAVIIVDEENQLSVFPIEFLDDAIFDAPSLLITAARAQYLKIATTTPIRINAHGLTREQLQYIANPVANSAALPALDFAPASEAEVLALALAKCAGLLPALLAREIKAGECEDWLRVSADAIASYLREPLLEVLPVSAAKLPIKGAEHMRIESFRSRYGTSVHLALIIGEPEKTDAPLVRVHSSCVTGDMLGSLRCDCGDQLQLALATIAKAGNGVLIYLHQEGRGIGIINKLRAYQLQEQGLNTYDANLALGFEEDERDFAIAASIINHLGLKKIRLLTNNPHKLAELKKAGIAVQERVSLAAPSGKHNEDYLQAKKDAGHQF